MVSSDNKGINHKQMWFDSDKGFEEGCNSH